MPFNIGTPELLIILFVALLILGPSKLPQLAKSLGEALREFRKASSGITEELSPQPVKTVSHKYSIIPAEMKEEKEELDIETLKKLADKLEISAEGKSESQLIKEIIEKAKEKGLLEEKAQEKV